MLKCGNMFYFEISLWVSMWGENAIPHETLFYEKAKFRIEYLKSVIIIKKG